MEPDELFRIEHVSAAVNAVANPGANPKLELPGAQLRRGFFGAWYDGGRVQCRYDPSIVDPAGWRAEIAARLSAEDAALVDFVPSRGPAGPLADLLDAVGEDWGPRMGRIRPFSCHVDMIREVVVADVSDRTPAEVLDALRAFGGELLEVNVFPDDGTSGRKSLSG